MRSRIRLLSFVVALLAIDCHVRAESPSLLLEKGLFQEQTAGNLDSAIGIYRQILQQEKDDRAVAAHAMYRLGECYAKKGQTALAISTLQQLVRKYPGQAEVVEKANARLVTLKEKASPTAPPIVLRTVPAPLANDVDPDLTKIAVTFDRPMLDGSWSWTGGGDTYPKTAGIPSYDHARRTCSLPVKLEPGKVYWVGINSPSFKNFQSASKVPAAPRAIVFATRSADGKPTPIPEKMIEEAKRFSGPEEGEDEEPEPVGPAPNVVSTMPRAIDNAVDAGLGKMSVTFDQEMTDQSWSWTGGGDTFPETTGKASYDAVKKTCTFPIKLQPGKVYWVGVNSPSNLNFKSDKGVPAVRYVILFATKSADGKPTPIPEEMLRGARQINTAAEHAAKGTAAPAPQIVSTAPQALDSAVDPKLERITVTFNQEMRDGSWSWTGGGDTFPEIIGRPAYDAAGKTCTLTVKVQPGKVYWVGVNGPSFKGFQNIDGVPAPWYAILFATKSADGKPTAIPEDMLKQARRINEAAKRSPANVSLKPVEKGRSSQ